jgi:hypothetical protein
MLRCAVVALMIVASALGPDYAGVARADEPVLALATATLTILNGAAQRVPAGASQPEPAEDGANLQVGDRIVTGANDRALVTFLDGSTVTVEPATDIVVQQADIGGPGAGSSINIRINLGTVWARIVRLADAGSNFSLSSSTATAVVHEGLPGAQQKSDGTFMCWTFDGEMTLTAANQRTVVLQPRETAAVQPGSPNLGVRPIRLNASTLRITTSGGVLPLVEMPDEARVAGFVAPGVEVNQVFGSFTDANEDTHVIEVPGGDAGPFNLVLEGQQDGDFNVDVEGLADGEHVYTQTLSGSITAGERLIAVIAQQLASGLSASNPTTAQVREGTVTPFEPLDDALPGRILLSPAELDSFASD